MKLSFSFTDEMGQETSLNKVIKPDSTGMRSEIQILLDEFKMFLLSMGFQSETVDKIDFIEE